MDITRHEIARIAGGVPGAVAVYLLRNGLEMLYYSKELPGVMGFSAEEYARRSDGDNYTLIVESDRPYILDMAKKLKPGEDVECSYRVHIGEHGFRWVHIRARQIGMQGGFPVAVVSYINTSLENDIYAELLNRGDALVYVSDATTWELLYANQRALDYWGHDHYLGCTCFHLFRGLEAPCPWCAIPRMNKGHILSEEVYDPGVDTYWHLECAAITWYGRQAFYVMATDISARMRADEELKESQQRYQLAIDGADIAVWEYDIRNHRIFSPEKSLSRFRLPDVIENIPDSLVGNVFEEDREKFIDMYRRIDAGETPVVCEFGGYLAQDESKHWVRVTCTGVKDEKGIPTRAYCVLQDITAQHFVQTQYEENLHQMLVANPGTLSSFRLNITTNVCESFHSADSYARSLAQSVTIDELVDKVAERIVDPRAQEEFRNTFNRSTAIGEFEKGRTERTITYRRRMDSGEIHWITTRSSLVRNPLTQDIIAAILVIDTDDEATEQEIVEQLTSRDYDYIAIIYPATSTIRIYHFNGMLPPSIEPEERMHADDYDHVCEAATKAWVADDSKEFFRRHYAIANLVAQLDVHDRYTYEINAWDSAGNPHRKQLAYVYLGGARDRILVMQHDITPLFQEEQRRQAELAAQLKREQELKDDAERANAAKSAFLSSMSHDMRTPLNGILGFTALALDADEIGPIKDYLGKIRLSGSIMLDLVNDTLALSRAESGKLLVEPTPTIPSDLFEHIVTPVHETANLKGITFTVDSEKLDDSPLLIDRLNMQKIVLNLLSNAVKFTPEGGTVNLTVESIAPLSDGMNMRIVVADSGIGIGPDFLPHVFEPFAQERIGGTGESAGTGLGLAIVQQLVNLMDGRIDVSSTPGEGTTFTLLMHFDPADAACVKDKEEPNGVRHGELAGRRVLLCEDNEFNTEIAMTLLDHEGVEVICADDGKVGFERFSSSKPGTFDAILMDLRMPVMDGYEATEAIRALDRDDARTIPIIAMSADAYESDVERCLDAGMNAHVAKPVDPKKLFETLGRLCS